MTSHRILITEEYLTAHLSFVFLFVYALEVLKVLGYFMQIFVNSVERLNSLVYSAPPCRLILTSTTACVIDDPKSGCVQGQVEK